MRRFRDNKSKIQNDDEGKQASARYASRRRIQETSHDERTILIQQKAAQATLSITIAATAFIGLGLIFLSKQGFFNYEQEGYELAFLSLFVMSAKAFFDWYYKNRLGG